MSLSEFYKQQEMSTDDAVIQVLLVTDDSIDSYILKKQLALPLFSRFRIHHMSDIQQAVTLSEYVLFDIMILDLSLKNCNSEETIERLSFFTERLPVVVLTGTDNPQNAITCLRRRAEDYLIKGEYEEVSLERTLRFAIERFRTTQKIIEIGREQEVTNQRLQRLAIMDPVTELLNRRGLEQILTRELELLKRGELGLLVIIIGLDHFKKINDNLGRVAGDIVLREISHRLKESLRATDYVARTGGDEFVILLPQTRYAEGVHVAEKIRLAISSMPVSVSEGKGLHVTASLGLGVIAEDTLSVDQLLAKTHKLLSRSKAEGKNCIAYEGRSIRKHVSDNHYMEKIYQDLEAGHHFCALKQPIIHLGEEKSVGYEMLSRATIKDFEMPDDFFRLSMERNMLSAVDLHCFKSCVEAAKALTDSHEYHVNLFPSTLIDNPTEVFLQIIKDSSNYRNCCVEISEQQIIGDPSYLIEPVQKLKKAGVNIAIDDVGFGRSCLESLVLLEPNIVKIDKKWVTGIHEKDSRQRSLARLLKVTDVLGAEVIAEGIETADDLKMLKSMNVRYGQGYYFGRPD